MAKASSPPPVDTNGEMDRARLALNRCRREIEKANLPAGWQRWVIDSLVASAPQDEAPKE